MVMAITITDLSLLKLLQLCSVNLPVGGFAFSQGLETACEINWVANSTDTKIWIETQITHSLEKLDFPCFIRAFHAAENQDNDELNYWNRYLLASRETHELYVADTAMGAALKRLLKSLNISIPISGDISFCVLFAYVCAHWNIEQQAAVMGFGWTWLEHQIAAAIKLVPLGQTVAQQLLLELQPLLATSVNESLLIQDDDIGGNLPGLSLASSLHETQYSRLFRS